MDRIESDHRMKLDKRIIMILIFAAILVCAIVGVAFSPKQTVKAVAVLRVERPPKMPVDDFVAYRNTQRRMILTDYVLQEAAEDPLVARTRFIAKQKSPAKALAAGLKDISDDADDELIVLSFECPDGDESITILNEIIDEYLSKIIVEARIQREGLLAGVKENHRRISENYEQLKRARTVFAEAAVRLAADEEKRKLRLTDWKTQLEVEKSQSTDSSRIDYLDQTIRYIDRQLKNTADQSNLTFDVALENLDDNLVRHQTRLDQIAGDLADWEAYSTPEITVKQHAQIADSDVED